MFYNLPIKTYLQFEQQLLRDFHQESIEDGVLHPAEEVLEDIFKNSPDAESWIQQFSEKYFSDSVIVPLVTCLGRSSYQVSFGYDLVQRCL